MMEFLSPSPNLRRRKAQRKVVESTPWGDSSGAAHRLLNLKVGPCALIQGCCVFVHQVKPTQMISRCSHVMTTKCRRLLHCVMCQENRVCVCVVSLSSQLTSMDEPSPACPIDLLFDQIQWVCFFKHVYLFIWNNILPLSLQSPLKGMPMCWNLIKASSPGTSLVS